jgi:NAD(P)-dependent dehydrogenase (short-subunit alcohol dehydrogenase family)
MKFKKKIYVVTGAFSGIGLATTENLLKKNYNVIAIGKSNLKLKKMYLKFNKFKKIFDPVVCDLGNFNSVKDLSFYIKKKYQSIDGLVNNVGINPSRNNIRGTKIKDWDQTLKINITSIFWITKFLIPIIKNKSSIVNISSVAALGMKNRIAYSSSKAALIGFTKSLAIDCAKKKIRVNCILPGYINTNLVKKYFRGLSKLEKKELVEKHALKKIGKPDDISNAVEFFLSEKSSWITGTILNVDGGYLLNTQKLR